MKEKAARLLYQSAIKIRFWIGQIFEEKTQKLIQLVTAEQIHLARSRLILF
jgi:hypothetical protein